ncbi:MAG TPA: GntR family transcriptional regulator [Gemmatimonadaceae bacterium]|jgi:GntR family transcriptional regulator|nr:GntR family transcriptional regulator [Gemmatimonadaceae bacterium]
MFQVDPKDPTPIYAQLERAIRTAIATGKLTAGARLPTVRQMAVDLHVNANTVARVYAELEKTEVVETQRGVGTFVRSSPAPSVVNRNRERELGKLIARLTTDASALGYTIPEVIEHLTRNQK